MKKGLRIVFLGSAILFFVLFLFNIFHYFTNGQGAGMFQFSASYLERNILLSLSLLFLILYIAIRFKRNEQ